MRRNAKDEIIQRTAVLKSLEIGIAKAAETYDMDEEELKQRQLLFLNETMHTVHGTHDLDKQKPTGSPIKELAIKLLVLTGLAALFWAVPFVLKRVVDPLTNTVIWAGFAALYLACFAEVGFDLVSRAYYQANFKFFNKYISPGEYDYESILKGDSLTDYEKCKLNQQKRLVFCGFVVYICAQLLSLLVPS